MKKNKKVISLLSLMLISNLLFYSCKKINPVDVTTNKPTNDSTKETVSNNSSESKGSENKLDSGEISNNIYINKYLGLSLKLLDGWYINDGVINDLLQKKEISDREKIVTIYRYKIGSTKEFNPSFMLTVNNAGNKSSKDYLNSIKGEMLNNSQDVNYTIEEDIHEEIFSGQAYDVFDVNVNMKDKKGNNIRQKNFCKRVKDYCIVFNYTYSTNEQLKDFETIKKNLIID